MSKGLKIWDDTNMEKETLPLTTFVSPRTGTEYLIVPKYSKRAYYVDGQQLWRDETTYEIVLNGNPVQFALSEDRIAASVEHFENPGRDLGSRYD
jgi:hypothetical protein